MPASIRALDKHLRDGRRFTIDLVPEHGTKWSYWMRATLDGVVIYDKFTAPIERHSTGIPELPHVIRIRFTELDPTTQQKRYVDRPVGLTDAEADGIEKAKREWTQRYVRAALAAAPYVPTWQIGGFTGPPLVGNAIYDHERGEPVMILGTAGKMWTEDGRSFGLDEEEGYLYTATVRALTPVERAEWDQEQAHDQQIAQDLDAARTLFGWPGREERPADAVEVEACPEGQSLYLPDGRMLVRTAGCIYSRSLYGGIAVTGTVLRHPITPERAGVFGRLFAASDEGQL